MEDMIADLKMWLEFINHQSVYSRSFMDFTKVWTADEVKFFTDSSRNFSLGFGGYCNKAWFQQRWDTFTKDANPSIQYLELYALTAGVLA